MLWRLVHGDRTRNNEIKNRQVQENYLDIEILACGTVCLTEGLKLHCLKALQ